MIYVVNNGTLYPDSEKVKNQLKLASLKYWARMDNPLKYKEFKHNEIFKYIDNIDRTSITDLKFQVEKQPKCSMKIVKKYIRCIVPSVMNILGTCMKIIDG